MEKKKQSGAEQFMQDVVRLMRYAGKPSREEIYQVTKIVVVSLLVVGAVGFVLKLILQAIIGA
jgi:protein translocase SEC61 complex gamma subunit